ncbi:DUF6624 domain-containing protein [Algoriphagus sediminis]|uniref:DUF6624 domain-containing protein n=1 Tax=Algoriphagus sediminis TaxID=3057113 RepID=UPI0025AFFC72|nr:DUF6624 domain-containing protein [Algoriphagus sediminis]
MAKEIKDMRDEDQKNRIKWSKMYQKGKFDSKKFKEFTKELIALDRQNTKRMREIIEEYGWPSYELVGEGPSNNAWLIVQHADRNPAFQARCLPLLKAAVDAGQANPSNYAYLYDRVAVSKGEKQLYATQSSSNNGLTEGNFYPIAREDSVQIRREAMNISRSVEDYAASMNFEYKIPDRKEADQRAEKLKNEYDKHVAIAREKFSNQEFEESADHYLIATAAYGHVTTEDFVQAAKALSLSEHEQISQATTLLTRALARGWNGFDVLIQDASMDYLKSELPGSWEDLKLVAEQIEIDLGKD